VCVVDIARAKAQYVILGTQLKAMNAKKTLIMERLQEAATTTAAPPDCLRCRELGAELAALNRRVAAMEQSRRAAPAQPRRAASKRSRPAAGQDVCAAKRRLDDDVEPSSDGSVRIVGEEAAP
jgi:hypothetical protein